MFETLVYIIIATIAALCIALEIYKWRIDRKLTNFVSGPNYPILGFAAQFIGKSNMDISEMINKLFMEQPDSVTAGKAWAGHILLITLSDPDDLKTVLMSDDCLERPFVYQFFDASNGLLSLPIPQWKHDRRHLGPTLGIKMVTQFVPTFNRKARKCCEIITSARSDINYHRAIVKCLLDIHFATTFGKDCDVQSPTGDALYSSMMTVAAHYQSRAVRPWLRWDTVYRMTKHYAAKQKAYLKIFNFVHEVAAIKSDEMQSTILNNRNSTDDIDKPSNLNLLEKCFVMLRKGQMTERTLNDNAYGFTAAVVDTTASTLYSTLLLLAMHPEYQEKVVDEMRDLFDSADSTVTLADCSRMTYTEMVIKESMRLLPATPLIARLTTADLTLRLGTVPKGTVILLNMDKIHRQERNWGPRSNEFYPEHFSAENMANQHPFTFIGFSAGPRNCMGTKYALVVMKIMLAHLLRNFKFISDLKVQDIRTEWSIVLKIKNENPFRCEPRIFK